MGFLYNQKASGEFFYLIWSNSPTNQRVYIIASILLITFQTGIIFSEELSEIYMANVSESVKAKSSIMNIDSFFNGLSGFFDIVVIARGFTPETLLFIIFVFLAISLMINFSFRRFDLIKDLIKYRKSVKQTNPFILTFSVLMMNYDIVFFTLSIIGFNSIPCRWISVTRTLGNDSNYLLENSFDHTFYDSLKFENDETRISVQVSYLSNEIVCYSNSHLMMVLMGVLLLFSNFLLKQRSNQLMGFIPSYKVFASKFGNADLLYDIILMIILVTKTLSFIYLRENYTMIRIIFVIYFLMLAIGYLAVFKYRPFYNYYQHRLKCFQILYLLTLTGFSILVRETDFSLINTEISTVIFMMLTMTLLLRMNDNLSRVDIQTLIEKTKEKKFVQKREMLTIYYLIITYIKKKIERGSKSFLSGRSQHDDVAFLINYLLEEHKSGCRNTYCFCKKSKITQMQSSLVFYQNNLEGNMVFEALYLLDEMLSEVVRANKTYNDNVFFCYINYLSNFMGRPTHAYKLLKQKMYEMSFGNKSQDPALARHRVQVSTLIFLLEHLAFKNLSNGSLSLTALRDQLGDFSEKRSEMKVVKHILFLNKMEELKNQMRRASHLKTKFLEVLRDSGKLKKCNSISIKFYKEKEMAYKTYWNLSETCRRKYAPLQLIFGYFVLNCCQDRELASKQLRNYAKVMHCASNLNKVFKVSEMKQQEFSVVYISAEPANFHQITYSSSNIFKWLGFKNRELLGNDLSMLIPNPLKQNHKDMIKINNITGKLLMDSQLRNMVCLTKEGFITPVKLGVRINAMIEHGIQFCGVLNFCLKRTESCIVIVNKLGKILELTKAADKFFTKDKSLMTHNQGFSKIFRDLSKVTKEKMFGVDKGKHYHLIARDKKRMKYWKTYCEWVDGSQINIITKNGAVSMMDINIDDYIIHSLRRFIRFVIVRKTNQQRFDFFKASMEGEDSEDKHLKLLFDYFEKERYKGLESMQGESEFYLEDDEFDRLYSRGDTRMFETHRRQFDTGSGLGSIAVNPREFGRERYNRGERKQVATLQDLSLKSSKFGPFPRMKNNSKGGGVPGTGSEEFKEALLKRNNAETFEIEEEENHLIGNISGQTHELNKKAPEDDGDSSLAKKRSTITKSKSSKGNNNYRQASSSMTKNLGRHPRDIESSSKILQKDSENKQTRRTSRRKTNHKKRDKISTLDLKRLKSTEERSSSGGSVNASRIKSRLIEKIIKKYFKPESPTKVYRFSQIYLVAFFVLHTLVVYFKDPMQKMTNQDIITQAKNVDAFSWEVWAQIYTGLYLDICRATERGMFPSEVNIEDYDEDIFERCHYLFRQTCTYYLSPDTIVDLAVKNLTFPYLYQYESFMTTRLQIEFYDVNYTTGEVSWRNVTMGRRSAVKLVQELAYRFLERDYQNGTGIVKNIGVDRDKDVIEEFMRRLNYGDLNKQYQLRTYDFYEYLKAVAYQNEMFVFYSTAAAIIFSVFMYFGFMVYLGYEISWMRDFYKRLFQVEVEDLTRAIETNFKKSEELALILQEEKIFESDLGKIFTQTPQSVKKRPNINSKKGKGVKSASVSRKEKIKFTAKGNYFGFIRLGVSFAIATTMIIVIQYVFYSLLYPRARKITNLLKVYIVSVEIWNSYATLNTIFINTLLWNSTVQFWGTDGLSTYQVMKSHIETNVLPNITESLDYDLGNYTDEWRKIVNQGNSCETVFSIQAEHHQKCYMYYDGLFNSNFMVVLKGMIKFADSELMEWERKRYSWDEVRNMFAKRSLRTMLTQYQRIMTTVFFSLSMKATNSLMKELKEDSKYLELMTYSMFVLIALSCILIHFNVVNRIQRLMGDFKTVVFIFPFGLIEKNLIMKHHLKRVSKGGHLYKI